MKKKEETARRGSQQWKVEDGFAKNMGKGYPTQKILILEGKNVLD